MVFEFLDPLIDFFKERIEYSREYRKERRELKRKTLKIDAKLDHLKNVARKQKQIEAMRSQIRSEPKTNSGKSIYEMEF